MGRLLPPSIPNFDQIGSAWTNVEKSPQSPNLSHLFSFGHTIQHKMTVSSGDNATKPVAIQNGHQKGEDEVIENFRPLSVVVIGAGFSGIYLGVRIPQRLRNVKLTIYEKNAGVGGTWYENRYPGCACDIPGPQITFLKFFTIETDETQSTFLPVYFCSKPGLVQLLCTSSRNSRVPGERCA